MNRKELILDFIKWYKHHHVKINHLIVSSKVIDHQNTTVDEYLEMLEAVEDLNDDNQLKPKLLKLDCTECVNSFMNPFDQYYCWKNYDIDKDEDCEGIYFKKRKK
jgi:hypothetical protein